MKKYCMWGMLALLPFLVTAQIPRIEPDDKGPVNSYYKTITAFDNFNGGAVMNNPTVATTFTLSQGALVTVIQTYHWNNGRGALPGTIKLQHTNGTVYGPWKVTGIAGSGGVANAFWNVNPNEILMAGTYTVIDSDKATWSQNSQSLNKGFTKVLAKTRW